MFVPFPKNWIELQSQAADIEIGAETSKPLKIIKEHSLIVTRVMAGPSESGLPILLPFPKTFSEMEALTEANSFGLRLNLRGVAFPHFDNEDEMDEWFQQKFESVMSGASPVDVAPVASNIESQKFESVMSCASPVVVAPVASNIESFEQTHAPDAEAPSADMNMQPYTFPSFKCAIGIRNIFMSLFTLVVVFLMPAMMTTVAQAVSPGEKRPRYVCPVGDGSPKPPPKATRSPRGTYHTPRGSELKKAVVVVGKGSKQSSRQLYLKTTATDLEKKKALGTALELDKKQVSRKIVI